jgi:hypothetical protein
MSVQSALKLKRLVQIASEKTTEESSKPVTYKLNDTNPSGTEDDSIEKSDKPMRPNKIRKLKQKFRKVKIINNFVLCFAGASGYEKIHYVQVVDKRASKESKEKIKEEAKHEAKLHMEKVLQDNAEYFRNLQRYYELWMMHQVASNTP